MTLEKSPLELGHSKARLRRHICYRAIVYQTLGTNEPTMSSSEDVATWNLVSRWISASTDANRSTLAFEQQSHPIAFESLRSFLHHVHGVPKRKGGHSGHGKARESIAPMASGASDHD